MGPPPACAGPHGRAGGYIVEAVDPVGSPLWSSFMAGPVYHEEKSPCWSRFIGRTCDPVSNPHWSEELQPIGRINGGEFVEDCLPWDRSHAGAR